MATLSVFTKDPDALLPWAVRWVPWLLNEGGDTIDTALTILEDDSALTVEATTELSGVVSIWISGGTPGTRETVTCRITTVGGRTDDRSFVVAIKER